ncbi:13786_t:CDS:2 [Acaulospora morrowiae]|uniref:13786_t:CDS:1 n=1 Tax=Acaulospora morrowiae TaxID=94023 RepID=A0A9N9B9M3_9GLOM|nr:13786_t:CDS:2 [Acaulospora morrowiae]
MALDQSKFYEILAKDLIKLLKDNNDHDMVITAGEEPDVRTFHVHSNILRARSTYFSTSMSEIWIRKKDGIIQFRKPNISPEVFEIILGYIYGGKTFEDNLDPSIIFDCVMAADELGIIEFLHYAQDYLMPNLSVDPSNWSAENHASLGKILKNCIEHIRFHNMDANEFRTKVLPFKGVLGTDYERISVYFPELLGKSANATGSQKSKKLMKMKLPSRGAIISTIMSSSHAAMIASWIDRKDLTTNQEAGGDGLNEKHTFQPYSTSEIPYKFYLLARGSRDGFSAKTFHSKCDGKRSTVTLFKLQDHDIFVGGYNPGIWNSVMWPQYKKDEKAFVFSFTQGGGTNGTNDIQGKIGRLTNPESYEYALNCWRSNGPSFGNLDLLMQGRKLTFKHKTYMPNVMPFDDKTVNTEDYEVFEVVEKAVNGKDADSDDILDG